jgi:hypothetical protein
MLVHEKWIDEKVLNLQKSFYPVKTMNRLREDEYFSNLEKKTMVKVLMEPVSRKHQYAMVQHYNTMFAQQMFAYVDVRKEIMGIWPSLRQFLADYEIYLDDYDFDTAWKRVQREFKRREKMKEQIAA